MKTFILLLLATCYLVATITCQDLSCDASAYQDLVDRGTVRAIEIAFLMRNSTCLKTIADCGELMTRTCRQICLGQTVANMMFEFDMCSPLVQNTCQNLGVQLCAQLANINQNVSNLCGSSICPDGLACCGAQCYNASIHECHTSSFLCDIGLSVCGNICYDQANQTCINDRLCPVGEKLCDNVCFDSEAQNCVLEEKICLPPNTFGCRLCPAGQKACGPSACYDPSTFKCENDIVVQI